MTAIATRADIFNRLAQGQGIDFCCDINNSGAAVTAGTSSCGFHTIALMPCKVGTTFPNTLQSFPLPPFSGSMKLVSAISQSGIARGQWLAYIYKIGTLALGATGNQFTHDAATFPALRTVFGVANQPITLLPFIQITTAPTVTAPAFIVRNNTGPGTGYVNQAGANVIGTKTHTLPSATTNINSCYTLMLENPTAGTLGDVGVQDIVQIDVQTAGTSSPAATVWGAELLCPIATGINTSTPNVLDRLFCGFGMPELAPAVATSGSIVSSLVCLSFGSTSATGTTSPFAIKAVQN